MEQLGKRQKRVVKLKSRRLNIGGGRENYLTKNRIILYANRNVRITQEQINSLRMDLTTPKGLTGGNLNLIGYYLINFTIIPNKILTTKGILVRMGKGKGKVKTYVKYLTPGTRCIELKPREGVVLNTNLTKRILKKVISKYSFLSTLYMI